MLAEDMTRAALTWWPELGMGWYPVTESPYDAAYFEKYRQMDQTATGAALTEARVYFVSRYCEGTVCDVGIGGGRFVTEYGARGFDINQEAVRWLIEQRAFADPYQTRFDALTFWDSLEHIHDIKGAVARAGRFVFVSLPIFTGHAHVLRSKHFRKDEHCWYFTRRGFVEFMDGEGFDLLECSLMEQALGREDIETFAFRRRAAYTAS
jgi:hypothetical protein